MKSTFELRNESSESFKWQEHQLLEAQRVAHIGCWSWNIRTSNINWSDEVYRILGLKAQQFSPTPDSILDFVHPEDRYSVQQEVQHAIQEKRSYSVEYRIIRPCGSERIIYGVGNVHCSEINDEPIEVIGVIQDITERKQMEKELKESESKYRGLLETAYDPIVMMDSEGNIEFANIQMKKWFGYDPSELIGQPLEILMPQRFRSLHRIHRAHYAKNPVARSMGRNLQLLAVRKDGTEFPVDISLSPFNTAKGPLVTAFIRDISMQKKIEGQTKFLSETSRILAETMDYIDQAQKIADVVVPELSDICIVHLMENGHLVPKAMSHSGIQDPQILWQLSGNEGIMRNNAPYGPAYVGRSRQSQLLEEVTDDILREISNNEKIFEQMKSFSVQSYIGVPMNARGKLVGVISFFRQRPRCLSSSDLAFAELVATRVATSLDNAKLLNDAQEAIRLREDILAIVSHDLKNPLGVLEGFNEIIQENYLLPESKEEILAATEVIASSTRQMKKMIGDLLDFAQIQSGNLPLDPGPILPYKLTWEGIKSIHHQAERKFIRIQTDLQEHLPEVYCDLDRIRQVFSNLLGNAIKFSKECTSVEVRSALMGAEVLFSISDHGIGIPEEHLPHLFDRYWQAKETAKLGTGLGLSIARGIIESSHGRIWAESILGQGTTFHFTLPVFRNLHASQRNSQTHREEHPEPGSITWH